MKLIAHRGNINGPNPLEENSIEYIERAIDQGYDVEIDIRYDIHDEKFYLGHDDPQHLVTWYWLASNKKNLWVHCKNLDALFYFSEYGGGFNYFWHQEDDFTLTSQKYIWTYPGKTYTPRSIIVMPEWSTKTEKLVDLKVLNCYGICSDYISYLK